MQYPTYRDLCLNVLLRLGEDKQIDRGEIIGNNAVNSYLKAIPVLLADALTLCATAGKYVCKSLQIINNPVPSVAGLAKGVTFCGGGESKVISGMGGQAYYWEMAGYGKVQIHVGDRLIKELHNPGADFTVYQGLLPNQAGEMVRLTFLAGSPYLYRNVAIYDTAFRQEADIYPYTPYRCYDLSGLAPDFYRLDPSANFWEEGINPVDFQGDHYYWQGDRKLILDNNVAGVWRVNYYAYPQQIPADISGNTVLYLDPEVYALVPLYIEGKLRVINDEQYATGILNEFESRRQELMAQNFGKPAAARVVGGEVL